MEKSFSAYCGLCENSSEQFANGFGAQSLIALINDT